MELSLQMDYILSPLDADSVAGFMSGIPRPSRRLSFDVRLRIRGHYPVLEQGGQKGRNIIIDEYTKLIQGHELTLLPGYVYATHRFSHELSTYGLRGDSVPPISLLQGGLRTGTGLDELVIRDNSTSQTKTKTENGND